MTTLSENNFSPPPPAQGLFSHLLKEESYDVKIGTRTVRLHHSFFNPKWLAQFKIVPHTTVELGAFNGGDAFRSIDLFPSCRVVTVEADPKRFSTIGL